MAHMKKLNNTKALSRVAMRPAGAKTHLPNMADPERGFHAAPSTVSLNPATSSMNPGVLLDAINHINGK
jgi:hypothetical protein